MEAAPTTQRPAILSLLKPLKAFKARFICFLCRRKFQSAALLTKHKQLSELHRRNLSKQEEENQQRKEELRQAVAATRRQVQERLGGVWRS